MKCPTCVKEGLKSSIQAGGYGTSTAMIIHRHYDEDGNLHVHNPNTHYSQYICSNGHKLGVSKKSKCPSCDYGGETEIRELNEKTSE